MKTAILNDLTKCKGCGACVLACQEMNELPAQQNPVTLSATAWTMLDRRGEVNIRRNCMHCLDPTCVSVCPVRALQKTPEGPVVYDAGRCIGCRYCMLACPFDIPKYEWDKPLPKIRKCVMCYERRIRRGQAPACTSVCPTGATKFGQRDELLREAVSRIANSPGRYVDQIYGQREAGGTSVLYLSPVPFSQLGFKTSVREEPYPRLTWDALTKIPDVVGIGGVMLVGVYWVINRRMKMEELQNERGATGNERDTLITGTDEEDSKK